MAHVKEAKSPFLPIMAYMCAWAGGTQPVFALGISKNRSFRIFFSDIVTTHNPSLFTHWRSQPVHTNGDPSRFPQCASVGDLRPHPPHIKRGAEPLPRGPTTKGSTKYKRGWQTRRREKWNLVLPKASSNTKAQKRIPQASCHDVWIESPSPQVKGAHTEVRGLQVHIPNPRGHTPSPYAQAKGPHNVCRLLVVFTVQATTCQNPPSQRECIEQHNDTMQYHVVPHCLFGTIAVASIGSSKSDVHH